MLNSQWKVILVQWRDTVHLDFIPDSAMVNSEM
jgi:hypothetical protein